MFSRDVTAANCLRAGQSSVRSNIPLKRLSSPIRTPDIRERNQNGQASQHQRSPSLGSSPLAHRDGPPPYLLRRTDGRPPHRCDTLRAVLLAPTERRPRTPRSIPRVAARARRAVLPMAHRGRHWHPHDPNRGFHCDVSTCYVLEGGRFGGGIDCCSELGRT